MIDIQVKSDKIKLCKLENGFTDVRLTTDKWFTASVIIVNSNISIDCGDNSIISINDTEMNFYDGEISGFLINIDPDIHRIEIGYIDEPDNKIIFRIYNKEDKEW